MAPEIVKSGVDSSVGYTTKAVSQPRRAYVTFLAGNGDYVKGVVGLIKGLRKVKSVYPLIVAVLPDVPEDHRRILFVEYEKLIYLDGDIQVYENIDHLFDLPNGYFYAVMDCFCEASWSKTPQYKIGYCQQCPEKVHWPTAELGPPPSLYFNAGFFVYEPSIPTYHDLLKTLKEVPPTSFAEQDFLNMYFNDKFKPLPIDYNLVLAFLWRHPESVDLNKVKVVHYCAAGSKPWRYTGEEENMDREDIKMLVKKWWDIYQDPSLDYNPAAESTAIDMKPFKEALSKAGFLNYVTAPSAA
uniref:Hexosyltransferase n=1 Tax=Chenopodium quinoa TaxID=63459 RepID=A0A803LEZ4_CHEQI